MKVYTQADLLRLAKRDHNTKRTYLLVNPMQGKHMPVSPGCALEMMRTLGRRMSQAEPGIDLVIGFAETATAVAAAAASAMGHFCRYIHTTRESFIGGETVEFLEEHSHAVEQRLSLERLRQWIEGASKVAFVDDELSTGRTLVNAMEQLEKVCPSLGSRRIVAGSIISRLTDVREAELAQHGISCVSLLRLPMSDYSEAVRDYEIDGAKLPEGRATEVSTLSLPPITEDSRLGVSLEYWLGQLRMFSRELVDVLRPRLIDKRVTILGTEEYMLPGLILGEALEMEGVAKRIRFHATTRSPIGICRAEGYPIRAGWRLHSFYESKRPTFIYNLEPCDVAVIVTDSPNDSAVALAQSDLSAALSETGCDEVILIREASHV